jgi:bifunctional non-homologous end joining protein LigD
VKDIDRGGSRRGARRSLPAFLPPMECTTVADIPDDPSLWLYEVKLDGYRCCAVADGRGTAQLFSRYGNPWPERFPAIHAALRALGEDVRLDGEIVAVDAKGRPSFQELQNWQSTRLRIVFYAFDVTWLAGRDLTRLPIEERKEILAAVGVKFEEPLRVAASLDAPLRRLVPEMKKLGLEGIIAKRRGTTYRSGERSPRWLKKRFNEVAELVVGGYIPEDDTFARLLVGEWNGGELRFVKKLKNGFSRFTRREVFAAIESLVVDECPFTGPVDLGKNDVAPVWVRPVRQVEVEFVERTSGGKLRHASFRRLVSPDDRSSGGSKGGPRRRRAGTR